MSGLAVIVYGSARAAALRALVEDLPEVLGPALSRVFLVVDDQPAEDALRVACADLELPWTAVRQGGALGCGARQQAGYAAALAAGHDPIAVLRSDRPARSLEPLWRRMLGSSLELVVGVRPRARGRGWARSVAGRALSQVQAALSGVPLSDFHSGVRVLRAAALRRVDFQAYAPGRAFDTELTLALLERGTSWASAEIPAGSGDAPLGSLGAYGLRCLGLAGEAFLARQRGRLAFAGPAYAPPAPPAPLAEARPAGSPRQGAKRLPLAK